MLDSGRPGREVIRAMAAQKVYIGRVWPSWPTYVRVSVSTREETSRSRSLAEGDERLAPDRRNYRAQVKRPLEPVPQPDIAKPDTVLSTFFDWQSGHSS